MTAVQHMLFVSTNMDERDTVRRLLHSPRHKLNRVASEIGIANPWVGSKRDLVTSIRKKQSPRPPQSPRKSKSKPKARVKSPPPIEVDTSSSTIQISVSETAVKPDIDRNTDEQYRNAHAYSYKIVNTSNLNGKTCKITQNVDDNYCRVTIRSDESSHLIPRSDLKRITGSGHRRKLAVSISTSENEAEDSPGIKPIESVEVIDNINHDVLTMEVEGSAEPTSAPELDPINTDHEVEEDEQVDVVAVAVFDRYYQIILSFMDPDVDYLFGTKFSSFRSECLRFLCSDHVNVMDMDQYEHRVTGKPLDSTLWWYCIWKNEKRIIFLVRDEAEEDSEQSDRSKASEPVLHRKCIMNLMMGCIDTMERRLASMSECPMETIRHLWTKKDKYDMGELTCKEWHRFLRALTGDRDLKEAASRKMFNGIDYNNVQAITLSQMVKYMKEHKQTLWELLLELATEYEVDNSAMLVYQQRALCKILGITLIALGMAINEVWEERLMEHIS